MPKIVLNLFGKWMIDYSSVTVKQDEKLEIFFHPKQSTFDFNINSTHPLF